MSSPGDYYDRKAREARTLEEQLAAARASGASAEEIRRLEALLAAARYVGD